MDITAAQAVFVKSAVDDVIATAERVRGPVLENTTAEAVSMLGNIGFQATNFGKAASTMNLLGKDRRVGISVLQQIAELEAAMNSRGSSEEVISEAVSELKKTLPPVVFLGVISTLFGTGVRDSISFLCEHAMIDVLVVSGGSLEHDLRRVAGSEYRTICSNNSQNSGAVAIDEEVPFGFGRFGNVIYDKHNEAYVKAMTLIVRRIEAECNAKKIEQIKNDSLLTQSQHCRGERGVLDGLVPLWVITPSEFWARVGELLPEYFGEEACSQSVTYWCAKKKIPIFCPSISDGDVMRCIFEEITNSTPSQDTPTFLPWPRRFASARNGPSASNRMAVTLQLDLVKDIKTLNRIAMRAHHTGIIICGGGVVKHHICNANLFRNGAEHAVYINNAQEYDGSDGGARPDEAISWGKIRSTATPVKIYSEITLVFPLLVAATFAQHVKKACQQDE